MDGRAPRGPCRALRITRQSTRGTWAPARLRWVLAAQCARQFAGRALGAAAWSSRLASWLGAGEGTGGPGKGLDTPRFASWRVVLDTQIGQLADGFGPPPWESLVGRVRWAEC